MIARSPKVPGVLLAMAVAVAVVALTLTGCSLLGPAPRNQMILPEPTIPTGATLPWTWTLRNAQDFVEMPGGPMLVSWSADGDCELNVWWSPLTGEAKPIFDTTVDHGTSKVVDLPPGLGSPIWSLECGSGDADAWTITVDRVPDGSPPAAPPAS